jgi:hypothetical protein
MLLISSLLLPSSKYQVDLIVTPTLPFFKGTPDGLPPALENACDLYEGKASGLCVSYCEAKDCDQFDRPGCAVVRQNFIDITGADMPCERCPCWARTDLLLLDATNADDLGELSCANLQTVDPYHNIVFMSGLGMVDEDTSTLFATFQIYGQLNFCGTYKSPQVQISEAEYNECAMQVENRCAEIGYPV